MLEAIKRKLKEDVAAARHEEVFGRLKTAVLRPDCPLYNDVLLLEGRYNEAKRAEHRNLVDFKEKNLESSKISHALLWLIDRIELADLADGALRPDPQTPAPKSERAIADLERQGYEQQLALATQKRQRLQTALLLETDAARQFAYEHEIQKLEAVVGDLKTKLQP